MKLVAFNYGTTEITGNMAFQAGDESAKIPIALLFFLIEDGDRKILVDVGCDTMPGFELSSHKSPVLVLESYGISRDEITDVIITHSHHDHIDCVGYYPQAVIHLQEKEFEDGKIYLKNSSNVSLFSDNRKVTENVEIRRIGGHSQGSSIVLVGEYVLCGDECYTRENLCENKPTGCSIDLEKSKAFVEEYGKDKYKTILFHDLEVLPDIGYKILYEKK